MAAGRMPEPTRDVLDRPFEARIVEWGHRAARVAHGMVMVLAARNDGLVSLPSLPDVHALHQPEAPEQVERAVHARDPDAAPLRAQPGGDLLRGEAAVLPREQIHDRLPRSTEAMALPADCTAGPLVPVAGRHPAYMIMILILVNLAPLKIRVVAASAAVAATATVLGACGSDDDRASTTVAATTGVTADIARSVAGPDAEVTQIVPDGASPHDFELSAQDRHTLEEADLVVANGSGLEAGIPLDELDTPTWELTEHTGGLAPLEEVEGNDHEHAEDEEAHAEEEEDEHGGDPHVWMDPTRVAAAAASLAVALGEADPAHADRYRARARDYARELRALDREIADEVAVVSPADRELVTSHDSLAYFADRYGFEVAATAFPATGAEAEASAARLRDVEQAVRDTGVPAVFAQDGDDPETLRLVAESTGVEVEYGLFVESPGAAGSYEEMLRRDAELIADSLRSHR